MKKIITIALLALSMSCNAQNTVFKASTLNNRAKMDTLVTKYKYEDKQGTQYPIIINKKSGRCYVWKKSGKTGRNYRMYMKLDISKEVARQLHIECK